MNEPTMICPDPKAIPKPVMMMLARSALQGARKSFENPEFRAEYEEWLKTRQDEADVDKALK